MRLGFAVAIHVDPDVLLIDEVLAVGDEAFTRKCLDKIGEFRRRGKTILLVTHSLGLVEKMCDDVLWLRHGKARGPGRSQARRGRLPDLRRRRRGGAPAPASHGQAAGDRGAGARRRPAEASPAGGYREGRWGGREVEIPAVRLLDARGRERHVYVPGETLDARARRCARAAAGRGLRLRRRPLHRRRRLRLRHQHPHRGLRPRRARRARPRCASSSRTCAWSRVPTCSTSPRTSATARPTTTTAACYSFRVKSRVKDVGVYRPRTAGRFSGGVELEPPRAAPRARPRRGRLSPSVARSDDRRRHGRARRSRSSLASATPGGPPAGAWSSPTAASTCCTPGTSRCSRRPAARATCWSSAINSDGSVRALKGAGPPARAARRERAELLLALEAVDRVVVYDEDTPLEVIAALAARRAGEGRRLGRGRDRGPRRGRGRRRARGARRALPGPLHHGASSSGSGGRDAAPGSLRSWSGLSRRGPRAALGGRTAPRSPASSGPRALLVRCCSPTRRCWWWCPRERDVEEAAQDLRTLAARGRPPGAVLSFPGARARRRSAACRAIPRPRCAGPPRCTRRARALRAVVASPAGLLRPSLAPRPARDARLSLRVGEEMTPEILLEALDEGGYRREDPVDGARPDGAPRRHPGYLPAGRAKSRSGSSSSATRSRACALRSRDPAHAAALEALEIAAALRPLRDALACSSAAERARRALRGPARARGLPGAHRARARCPTSWPSCCRSSPGPPCRRGAPRRRRRGGRRARRRCARRPRRSSTRAARGARAHGRGRCCPRPARRSSPPQALAARLAEAPRSTCARSTREGAALHLASRPCAATPATPGAWPRSCGARRPRRVIFLGNPGRAERLRDVLREDGPRRRRGHAQRGRVGALSRGFELPEAGLRVLADGDVFPEEVHVHARGRRRGVRSFLSDFRDLKIGDLVVHEDHGIGRFEGLETLEVGGTAREFMVLPTRAATSSRSRSTPSTAIQKYASAEGARPAVDRLGSGQLGEDQEARQEGDARHGGGAAAALRRAQGAPGPRLQRREPLAARVRGGLRVRGDARPGAGHRRGGGRHGAAGADGPPGLRRRRLRQDRGRDARRDARRARRQAGGGAGADHRAGLPALQDLPEALRARSRSRSRWSRASARRRRSRRCWRARRRAGSTS